VSCYVNWLADVIEDEIEEAAAMLKQGLTSALLLSVVWCFTGFGC
jgi:hypothetical protein